MSIVPSFKSHVASEAVPANTELDDSQYGYVPTLWICALFVSLYGLSTSESTTADILCIDVN